MKNTIQHLLLITGILLPQLTFSTYELILVVWIILGGTLKILETKKIALKGFFLQLLINCILLFAWKGNELYYLEEIMVELELPDTLVPIIGIVFNGLTVLFCLLLGINLVALFRKNKKSLSEKFKAH